MPLKRGLGAALMQSHKDKLQPVAYASRTLSKAESNYSDTGLEALAIMWALKHYRHLVYGDPVHVLTDHAPLVELFKDRNHAGKLTRWYLTIQEFSPMFMYLQGKANLAADALSKHVALVTPT